MTVQYIYQYNIPSHFHFSFSHPYLTIMIPFIGSSINFYALSELLQIFVWSSYSSGWIFYSLSLKILYLSSRPAMRKNPFNLFLLGIAICVCIPLSPYHIHIIQFIKFIIIYFFQDMTLMASYFIYKQVSNLTL